MGRDLPLRDDAFEPHLARMGEDGRSASADRPLNGRQDQLEGKIQERYGIAKDQARKDVDTWFQTLPSAPGLLRSGVTQSRLLST